MKSIKFNYLIKNYKKDIYNFSFYLVKNKMDAEDITQEVMIKIWENMDNFKFSSAKVWIIRTTRNICIDLLRKRKIYTNNEIEIDEQFEDEFGDNNSSNNPLKIMEIEFLSEKIKQAIQNLPENLRTIFVLYEINELKYKEIAKTLDIPINSVKVYLLRARRMLQEDLKNYA